MIDCPRNWPIRFISSCRSDDCILEVLFNGGSWSLGGEKRANPDSTDVTVRYLRRPNPNYNNDMWVEFWSKKFGDLSMPGGAWNGVRLAEIFDGRLFVAVSNRLIELDSESGDVVWEKVTGNTPIYYLLKSEKHDHIVVQNGYYQFSDPNGLSNLAAYTIDGKEVWRCECRATGDFFCNPQRYQNNALTVSTWNCFRCEIDEATGSITKTSFTK
jgi:outer membrane protein assembly factor BamB